MTLSVVVTVVDGAAALERCLAALAAQQGAPPLEVLVPWDQTIAAAANEVAPRHPAVRFAPMGAPPLTHPAGSAAGLHELYDRRRAAGLAAATGRLVAMLEDRSIPRPDWAAAMAAAHERLPHAVIGGPLACGRQGLLSVADYLCDFARYEPPQPPGRRDYVSVCNVAYKREVLDATRGSWQGRWYETKVHWALARAGHQLWLTPEPVVDQVRLDGAGPGVILGERLAWGRRFAAARAAELGRARSLLYGLLSPALPLVMLMRLGAMQAGRGQLGRFLAAAPACLGIYAAWSAGELVGYFTRRE